MHMTFFKPDKTFLLYGGLLGVVALLLCTPAVFQPDSIIGLDERLGDRANSLWLHWATYTNTSIEDRIFAPLGVNSSLNYFNLLDAYLAVPLIALFGWPGYYNWLIFAIAVFNGLAAWLFSRTTGANSMQAILLSVVFMVSFPFLGSIEHGRLIQALIGVLPLACMGIWKLHEKPDFKSATIAGVTVALAGWVYLFYGYALALISMYFTVTRWRFWKKSHWLLFFYAICALSAWWLLKDLLQYIDTIETDGGPFPEPSVMFQPKFFGVSGSILDHSVPLGFWGWSTKASLPIVLSVTALVGLWDSKRWFLVPLIGLFVVLAMGPYFKLDSGWIGMETNALVGSAPYLWMYEHMPLIHRMKWPDRWLAVVLTLLLPLAVRGLSRVPLKLFWVPVFGVFLFLESKVKGHWPLSYTSFEPPRCYLELAQKPEGLLLISPFVYSDRAIVYQPLHKKRIVNPVGSSYDEVKWTEEYHFFIESHQLLRWVRDLDHPTTIVDEPAPLLRDLEQARAAGIRYFAHHLTYLSDALNSPDIRKDHSRDEQRIRGMFITGLGEPICVDSSVAVWEL